MKRSTIRLIWILGAIPIMVLGYSNCSQPGNRMAFSEASKTDASSTPIVRETAPNRFEFSKLVKAVETKSKDIDIVWIVDNSGSMSEEAAHVRANIDAFVDYLKYFSDVRLALVSQKGNSGTRVGLKSTSADRIQIDQVVDSTNDLEILARLFCKPDLNPNCPTGQNSGALVNFFRPNAQKVFVIVTDDRSKMTTKDFMQNHFSKSYPNENPVIYNFSGLGWELSPCQWNQNATGTVYHELADMTGGRTYNICDTSWSNHFKDLVGAVASLSVPAVSLPKPTNQLNIISISLDGRELTSNEFTLTATGVALSKDLFAVVKTQVLKVIYELK